jgi:small subunit ribosomal protein S17
MPAKTTTKSAAKPASKAATKPVAAPAPDAMPVSTKIGVVDSDAREKTRKVVLNYLDQHPKYGKYVRKRTVLHVHDENNESHNGDLVEVAPCRPLSKTKSWKLVRVVEKRAAQAAAIKSVKEVQ